MVEFNIINFDVSILGNLYNAKSSFNASAFNPSPSCATTRGKAVITPWGNEKSENSIVSQYNRVRNKTKFIDENTSTVRKAGFDKDDKALFTLYSALTDLRAIAAYAAERNTPESSLAKLSSQFTKGLFQASEYVRKAELDKLALIFGEKQSYVTSDAGLGKNDRDIKGGAVAALSKTSPILGINGDEIFTIKIKASSTAEDTFVINLSDISGDVTLENLKELINTKVSELTTVNSDGDTVSKYRSRVKIDALSGGKFGFTFDVDGIEELTFNASVVNPALIVVGTQRSGTFGSVETGVLSKYTNLDSSDPTRTFNNDIAGINSNEFKILSDGESTASTNEKTGLETSPNAVQVDSQGNIYVVGKSKGDFEGQFNAAKTNDVFLSKYDSNGSIIWSRLLGASDDANAFALTIDGNDNIIIAGKVNEELIASDVFSGTDSFVTKYTSAGEELFTKQLDSVATDQANSLTVDANGDIYFTGQIYGRLNSSTTDYGKSDSILVKLSGSNGNVVATTQFGGAENDYGQQIVVASDGHILVASSEDGNAFIRKIDKDNLDNVLATYDIGALSGGKITGLSVEGNEVFISGVTQNGSFSGGGSVVSSYSGGNDGFIAKINASTGAILFQEQFGGSSGYSESSAIAFSQNGSSVLDKLGLPTGQVESSQTRNIETQTSARIGDHFYISINGGRNIKIDIRDGDSFSTLSKRINTLSLRYIKSSVTIGENGPQLKIEGKNGSEIQIIAGKGGTNALPKLGLEEKKIFSVEKLFDLKGEDYGPDKLGGIFAFNLQSNFVLNDKKQAEYILGQLDKAIDVIKSAHRSLTFDPFKAEILRKSKLNFGPPPAYLAKQLASYQDGLRRIQSITGLGTF